MDDPERVLSDIFGSVHHRKGWKAATFLTESFSESGHAEKMAATLCSYIPFPTHVGINLSHNAEIICHILEACKTFANVQKPVQLTIVESSEGVSRHASVAESIQSCSQLQTLSIFTPYTTAYPETRLYQSLLYK